MCKSHRDGAPLEDREMEEETISGVEMKLLLLVCYLCMIQLCISN